MSRWIAGILFFCLCFSQPCSAQERLSAIGYNALLKNNPRVAERSAMLKVLKTTALPLPFFDDFSGNSIFPDSSKWTDIEAYINNTMPVDPPTRGVATLDALNQYGVPYDTMYNTVTMYADSLTSQPIDIGMYTAADSLYLSFFYQPQGNGFYPQPQDSLFVYVHRSNNDWIKIWAAPGDTLQPFVQAMVPLTDSLIFFSGFQFRFVNKATFMYSGSTWNIDYVRVGANRNMNDTLVNDVAFNQDPSFMLNDYTFMPYRQFLADTAGERAAQLNTVIKNNFLSPQTVQYAYMATETTTGTPLAASTAASATMPGADTQTINFPSYNTVISSPGANSKIVFENKYYINPIAGDTVRENDTIIRDQVFDNYLAYDDGTAEKAWYLHLGSTLPGEFAIEYHLNQPDTMRGIAVYFGRQAPLSTYKFFNFIVYRGIAGITPGYAANDTLFYEPDNTLSPAYTDTINHFWVFAFDKPVPIPKGTFYAGMFIPAYSASDSLYIGLDANRQGYNHLFYNVDGFTWHPSEISGALMFRPLLGQYIVSTGMHELQYNDVKFRLSPNPATNTIYINAPGLNSAAYHIQDMQGREVAKGMLTGNGDVNVSYLTPGLYLAYISVNGNKSVPQKFIKL